MENTRYTIETRHASTRNGTWSQWTVRGLGDDEANTFASEEEADAAIEALRCLGPDWEAAEYRVVEVRS